MCPSWTGGLGWETGIHFGWEGFEASVCRSEHVEMLLFDRWLETCIWSSGEREIFRTCYSSRG